MFSITGLGPDAKKILNKVPNNSFGKNCVFERLLKQKNMKICTIGLGYNWIPFLHYLDWLNQVPFRFEKKLTGSIKTNLGVKKIRWIFYARYLRDETVSNGYKIGNKAKKSGLFITAKIGRSIMHQTSYKRLFIFSKKLTSKNKWLTVEGPKYKI